MQSTSFIAVAVLLLSLVFGTASAQNKTMVYYDNHPSEILPDANTAFRNADYERAAELCKWHYIIVGDSRADALQKKAEQCLKLTGEMNALFSGGKYDAAREKATALLALNPDDRKAKEINVYNPTRGKKNGYEWVDLGLPSGTLWATHNIGATKPEDYGDYFAWGETSGYKSGKTKFNEGTYKWFTGNQVKKYCLDTYYNSTPDNKYLLEPEDDAATVQWGREWCMPTKEQFEELLDHCTWTWTKVQGVKGFELKGENGNTLFLPGAGEATSTDNGWYGVGFDGDYWTKSLALGNSNCAMCLYFRYFDRNIIKVQHERRENGMSIRPVCVEKVAQTQKTLHGEINGHGWVDLGLSVKWATCNIGASSPSENGDYFAWGETSPKAEYTWKSYKFRVTGNKDKNVTFSKYNTQSSHGDVDGKVTLELSDDAAHVHWGSTWRMPTADEMYELQRECIWLWTTQDGRNGYLVKGTNGNSIFLPAAGAWEKTDLLNVGIYGAYWESSLDRNSSIGASHVYLDNNTNGDLTPFYGRFYGFTIRPVTE